MLSALVTSHHRRTLLRLLWHEGVSGTPQELAELGDMALSVAQRELAVLHDNGLTLVSSVGRGNQHSANCSAPGANSLLGLLEGEFGPRPGSPESMKPDEVRKYLRVEGAPLELKGPAPSKGFGGRLEVLLAAAVALSRQDPTVAVVLPVVLWNRREDWSEKRLAFECKRLGVGEELGLFLDMTARLSGNRRFRTFAQGLRDNRRHRMRSFFVHRSQGEFAKKAALANTPGVAKKWHFMMNLPETAFERQFQRHAHD